MKKNQFDEIFKKKCAVCNKIVLADIYGQGECPHCHWYNSNMNEEHENKVIFPNLISLTKAKSLYKEGKTFTPSLSDFLDGFMFYGEMKFVYNNIDCELIRSNNESGISFCYEEGNTILFTDKEDFIKNAKIGDEYVRDIWDKVEDPSYM